jgi:hypothetical protein
MNKSVRHHFVSEVLTKNFTDDDGKVPYYDKLGDYIAVAKSAKAIFWEENLNTTIAPTGEYDCESVEATLNRHFEQISQNTTNFSLVHWKVGISLI